MRTTLNLDDGLLRIVRSLATSQGKTVGHVVSELIRRGLQPTPPSLHHGFPTFDVPDNAPTITPEMVRDALEDVG